MIDPAADVTKATVYLESMPEADRPHAAAMLDAPGIPVSDALTMLRTLAAMTPENRLAVFEDFESWAEPFLSSGTFAIARGLMARRVCGLKCDIRDGNWPKPAPRWDGYKSSHQRLWRHVGRTEKGLKATKLCYPEFVEQFGEDAEEHLEYYAKSVAEMGREVVWCGLPDNFKGVPYGIGMTESQYQEQAD
jgi:hypothetical protein